MNEIVGYIVALIYYNESNGYSVSKVRLDQKKDEYIFVVGNYELPNKDELVKFYGEYISHVRYGRQFQVQYIEKMLPNDKEGVIRYLQSSAFNGIGRKSAEKIVEVLGKDCLEIIKENPNVLDRLELNEKKKKAILQGLKNEDPLLEAKKIFLGHGLSVKDLLKLDAYYKEELVSKILSNPYQIVEDIDGIGFKTADKIAKYLKIPENDKRRVLSAIIYALNNLCFKNSSTFEDDRSIFKEVSTLINDYNYEEFLDDLNSLTLNKKIIFENGFYYPLNLYVAEVNVANYLANFLKKDYLKLPQEIVEDNLKIVEKESGIKYSEDQIKAITNTLNSNFSIIIGGPGTGKTTILYAICKMLRLINNNITINLCAPTGRASKRMRELTKEHATTIHSLLEWDLETNTFNKNHFNNIVGDVLIVDEFSMVDISLLYHLLDATLAFKKVIFIGDEKQLPPVASGNVLKTLVDLNLANINTLTYIHRQDENSGIIPFSYLVRKGEFDPSYLNKDDIKFIEGDALKIKEGIKKIYTFYLEKGYDIKDIQLLAPKYEGMVGINNLNDLLQEVLNPPSEEKKEVTIGRFIFRENDKILQLKNQPDDDVYNGDIGILLSIEKDINNNTLLYVDFDGNIVCYDSKTLANITLGYAISVHKAQGSEYKVVLLPLLGEQYIMLRRKLIYTALTRAKKYLYILGDPRCLEIGISRDDEKNPNFSLKERLLNLL